MKEKIMGLWDKMTGKLSPGGKKAVTIGLGILLMVILVGVALLIINMGGDGSNSDKVSSENISSQGNLSNDDKKSSKDKDKKDDKDNKDKEETTKETESATETSSLKNDEENTTGDAGTEAGNASNQADNTAASNAGSAISAEEKAQIENNIINGSVSEVAGNSQPVDRGSIATGNNSTADYKGTDTVQANQETMYNKLFDINTKVTIKLEITDSELQKLQADYVKYGSDGSPIYRRVSKMTVTLGNDTYVMYDVGVKMKGNTSRVSVYNNNDVNDRNLIHLKLSFDEAFDNETYYGDESEEWSTADRAARKSRTFATLNGLELKWNRNFDSTYVANYYMNATFRANNVVAQNTNVANINFGGYNYGVYTIYEPVDGNFLERNFPADKKGDLYKCGWSNTGANYTSTSGIGSVYELKTNTKKSTNANLTNLINTLNSSNVSKSTFSSVVNIDSWVRYAAVSWFMGNNDDMRNNYNNHYVYFMSNKAVFIPYDYDRGLGVGTNGYDMTGYAPDTTATAKMGNQANPLFTKSITGKSNNLTSEFKNAMAQVASSGWINYNNYKNIYNIANSHYSSVAIPSANVHAYVKEFGQSSGKDYPLSALYFAESNSYNQTSVSTYLTKAMNAYNSWK